MRLLSFLTVGLVGCLLTIGPGLAETPALPSPLRLIPAEADVLVEVPNPRALADVLRKLETLAEVQKLAPVKEQLDSTSARRARQLLAYFEKKLGGKWPELLEKLAGGGIALGGQFGTDPRAVLVLQGSDEKLAGQFLDLVAVVLEGELARQENKQKLEKLVHDGIPGFRVGTGFWIARAGAALVLANNKEALTAALSLSRDKGGKSMATLKGVAEAGKLLPPAPLARAWLNMKRIHASEPAKALYKMPRDNPALTVLFGRYLDVVGRSPWLTADLMREKDDFRFTVRAPRGKSGMGSDRLLHLPPEGEPGCRPLVEPRGVLYSSSFYLDVASIWKDRDQLFVKAQADNLARFDKSSGRVLAGIRLSTLLEAVGARHRLVVVNQPKVDYAKKPKVALPAFAFVAELRQEEKFARAMDTLLRTAGLFASGQLKMELAETKHRGVDIVGYRFDEKAELKEDVNDIRFNFSPCFCRVGKQLVFCSTALLCRELIELLQAEQKAKDPGDAGFGRDRFYVSGFADLLHALEDTLLTQTILDQAVSPAEAREQVKALIQLVRGLGVLSSEIHFDEKSFRYEFRTGK